MAQDALSVSHTRSYFLFTLPRASLCTSVLMRLPISLLLLPLEPLRATHRCQTCCPDQCLPHTHVPRRPWLLCTCLQFHAGFALDLGLVVQNAVVQIIDGSYAHGLCKVELDVLECAHVMRGQLDMQSPLEGRCAVYTLLTCRYSDPSERANPAASGLWRGEVLAESMAFHIRSPGTIFSLYLEFSG